MEQNSSEIIKLSKKYNLKTSEGWLNYMKEYRQINKDKLH